ncbi:ATP-binding protein [Ferruginibacter sp.]
MIARILKKVLTNSMQYYPVLSLNGPRQSGKSTLVKKVFPKLPYVNLENPAERAFAATDSMGFLQQFPKGAVIDEAQYVPELFSYIQVLTDENQELKFVLTGSQNFMMHQKIAQSLAGRVGINTLLPFSFEELKKGKILPATLNELLFNGFYPRLYDKNIPPTDYYANYVNTYIERDIQALINNSNLSQFIKFIQLCAGRAGQIVNMVALANDTGVSPVTIQNWLAILQRSYVVYLLQPYYNNFNKRLMKNPKLYFYDTGLLCYLLGLQKANDITNHFAKGAIFENFVLVEILKYHYNLGLRPQIFYIQNNHQKEIDFVLQQGTALTAIEVKSSGTPDISMFKNLSFLDELNGLENKKVVVYTGEKDAVRKQGLLVGWKNLHKLFAK